MGFMGILVKYTQAIFYLRKGDYHTMTRSASPLPLSMSTLRLLKERIPKSFQSASLASGVALVQATLYLLSVLKPRFKVVSCRGWSVGFHAQVEGFRATGLYVVSAG